MMKRRIPVNRNFEVSVIEMDGKFELAIMYNPHPLLDRFDWSIDYDGMEKIFGSPDVLQVESEMQVYGALQEIRQAIDEMSIC